LSGCRHDSRGVSGLQLYEVQVADLAEAMSLRLRSQLIRYFGFTPRVWAGYWYGPATPPFETIHFFTAAAEREAAHHRTWAWLDRQPGAPPKPTK
jgi:hypothetical protein